MKQLVVLWMAGALAVAGVACSDDGGDNSASDDNDPGAWDLPDTFTPVLCTCTS